mmetsp:Transcript_26951/g.62194  ORF Transcript_26951/g.62194 Transcript_26951/m.62194 type:complete len:361 (+) Transcript_26951:73-1155(+)
MFQPAAVRTLLDLRSVDRPATARVRGQEQSILSCREFAQADCSGRPCSAPAVFEVASSASTACPSTASSAVSGRDDIGLMLVGGRDPSCQETCKLEVLDEDHLEDCEDVPSILEKASTMLFQLKHAWQEEREADLEHYWRGMEELFGTHLDRAAQTGSLQTAAPLDDDLQDASAIAQRDMDEVEEHAEMALGSIEQQVEAARRLRVELERRLSEGAGQTELAPSSSDSEADERIAILRKQVSKLKSQKEDDTGFAYDSSDEDALVSLHGGPPELFALHRWMEEDLYSFHLAMGDNLLDPGREEFQHHDRGSKRGNAECSLSSATAPSEMVKQAEEQLDDMLRELDEIDRIHEDLHMLTLD